jgi:hypothetical protein
MDEVKGMAKKFSEIETELEKRGLEPKFDDEIQGMKMVVEYDNPKESFDDASDAEIKGAYRVRQKIDQKDSKEVKKSNEAKKQLKDGSMDSAEKVSFSQVPLHVLKEAKKRQQAKRGA